MPQLARAVTVHASRGDASLGSLHPADAEALGGGRG